MDRDELRKILEAINEAYELTGRQVQTAILYDPEGPEEGEIVIDNRNESDIN